jgi:phosphate starvation-inducible PhoH-like protein
MVTKKIYLKSSEEVVHLLGQQDENLRRLERAYGVQIFVRQGNYAGDFSLVVRGPGGKVDKTLVELEHLRRVERGQIQGDHREPQGAHIYHQDSDIVYVTYQGKNIRPSSENQKRYVDYVKTHELVFGIGPAGTGKTFLAVACALRALQSGAVSRLVITRPVVEAGERLGFLPGDLYEKINPYLKPLYDAFYMMLGPERFRFMREEETIEIVPLAYMRGRTIDDAFMILDEAQNTTPEQMKMFLTRMGNNSRIIVTGDVTQIDLENKKKSGLVVVEKILQPVNEIRFVHFGSDDVVRHQMVKRIIKAYDDWDKKRPKE